MTIDLNDPSAMRQALILSNLGTNRATRLVHAVGASFRAIATNSEHPDVATWRQGPCQPPLIRERTDLDALHERARAAGLITAVETNPPALAIGPAYTNTLARVLGESRNDEQSSESELSSRRDDSTFTISLKQEERRP